MCRSCAEWLRLPEWIPPAEGLDPALLGAEEVVDGRVVRWGKACANCGAADVALERDVNELGRGWRCANTSACDDRYPTREQRFGRWPKPATLSTLRLSPRISA